MLRKNFLNLLVYNRASNHVFMCIFVVVEDIKSLLVSCPSRPYYGSVMSIFVNNDRQPIFFSFIDRNGNIIFCLFSRKVFRVFESYLYFFLGLLRGHDLLPVLAMNQRRDKIKQLMIQYKPETIGMNFVLTCADYMFSS